MARLFAHSVTAEQRVLEKADSRRQDVHALVSREKTFEQVRRENTPISLSGERIDFSRLTSKI